MDNSTRELIIKLSCAIKNTIRKFRIIIIITTLFAVGFDVYSTLTFHAQYYDSVTVRFVSGKESTFEGLEDAVVYMKNMNYIFNSDVVKNYVCSKLGIESTSLNCSVSSVNSTNIATISVTADNGREAFYGVNYILEWYNANKEEYQFNYSAIVMSQGSVGIHSYNRNSHFKNLLIGGIAGVVLSNISILLYFYFTNTIKTSREINRKIGTRLFAKIPKERKKLKKIGLVITSLRTSFTYKEAIKYLRGRLEESCKKHHYQSILIASSLENEGKSSVAVNLAIALAQAGKKVLLIDADFRKPSLHLLLEMNTPEVTVNEYLKGEATLEELPEATKVENLDVLINKKDIRHAEELVSNPLFGKLIEAEKANYQYIIIDTPPARYLPDAVLLNEAVDASLLVIKQDAANIHEINDTINRLNGAKENLIGAIYNASIHDFTAAEKGYGYGKYGYKKRGA